VTLRARIVSYLALLHLAFGGILIWAFDASWPAILAVEAAALVSLITGIALSERVVRVADIGESSARLIREGDLTARLRPVGEPRVDRLIDVYNAMVDALRLERARIVEQRHFLEQVIGGSPSGVLVLTFDDEVAEINPAAQRLLGVGRQMVGRPVRDVDSPVARMLESLAVGETATMALAGGRRLRCYRGRFMDRGFPRAFFLLDELTDEARRIERAAYEKLIRVMSHEVNNSVTATNSLLESSLTYAADLPAERRADFERGVRIAVDRASQLNQFMRRFADVYRLPAPVRQRIDLVALVERLLTLITAQARTTRMGWQWPGRPLDPVWVHVDPGQLEQVVLNVLKNACEAASPAGEVVVETSTGEWGARLIVEDSGPGFDAETEAHLFTPFFSTKPHGQGIGLTVVGEVLSQHGCEYGFERREGRTRFYILFRPPAEAHP
jgi:two-component system nitrogen regulation sensor histidine kinase NtrY